MFDCFNLWNPFGDLVKFWYLIGVSNFRLMGILNVVSLGTLMPVTAIFARYLKVSNACQYSEYALESPFCLRSSLGTKTKTLNLKTQLKSKFLEIPMNSDLEVFYFRFLLNICIQTHRILIRWIERWRKEKKNGRGGRKKWYELSRTSN